MPDLNLKGEEEQPTDTAEESEVDGKRKMWLVVLIVVVLAAAAFVVIRLGIFRPEHRETTLSAAESSLKPDTFVQAFKPVDSLARDASKTGARLTPTEMGPDSTAVVVPDSSLTSKPHGRYAIQLSAWQSNKKAEQEMARLKGLGLDVYLVKSEPDSAGRTWNRVR